MSLSVSATCFVRCSPYVNLYKLAKKTRVGCNIFFIPVYLRNQHNCYCSDNGSYCSGYQEYTRAYYGQCHIKSQFSFLDTAEAQEWEKLCMNEWNQSGVRGVHWLQREMNPREQIAMGNNQPWAAWRGRAVHHHQETQGLCQYKPVQLRQHSDSTSSARVPTGP